MGSRAPFSPMAQPLINGDAVRRTLPDDLPRRPAMQPNKLYLLRNAMQAYAWRTQALSSNIANIDTPGYQRVSVSFEEELRDVRRNIEMSRGPEDIQADFEVEDGPPILEDEMMTLADTQMRNALTVRGLREHFDLMRTSITGRTG